MSEADFQKAVLGRLDRIEEGLFGNPLVKNGSTPEGKGIVGRLADVEACKHTHRGTYDRLWSFVVSAALLAVGWLMAQINK